MEVLDMVEQGASVSDVLRGTGLSRVTIRRLLRQGGPQPRKRRTPPPGVADGCMDLLLGKLAQGVISRPVLFRLAKGQGYRGSLRTIQADTQAAPGGTSGRAGGAIRNGARRTSAGGLRPGLAARLFRDAAHNLVSGVCPQVSDCSRLPVVDAADID